MLLRTHCGIGHQASRTTRRLLAISVAAAVLTAASLYALVAQSARAATPTVTNCNDSGPGSLRQAVTSASSGDVISFALSPSCSTITLTSGTIDIPVDLSIQGPSASSLAVSGNAEFNVFEVASGIIASISGLTIEKGTTNPDGAGAGISNLGNLTLTNDVISGNDGLYFGAGISNSAGALSIQDSTVANNQLPTNNGASAYGGGVWSDGGSVTISNSTFSGNVATYGGAIMAEDTALTITNSTISGNTAGESSTAGGGIWSGFGGSVSIGATIIADSTGGDCFLGTFEIPSFTDLGYNLDDDGSCGFNVASPFSDLSDTNPDLGPLQNNGGSTPTMALLEGSPAIEHVTSQSLCPATDQRGVPRAVPCDIGAYQTSPPPPILIAAQNLLTFFSAPPDEPNSVLSSLGLGDPYASTVAVLSPLVTGDWDQLTQGNPLSASQTATLEDVVAVLQLVLPDVPTNQLEKPAQFAFSAQNVYSSEWGAAYAVGQQLGQNAVGVGASTTSLGIDIASATISGGLGKAIGKYLTKAISDASASIQKLLESQVNQGTGLAASLAQELGAAYAISPTTTNAEKAQITQSIASDALALNGFAIDPYLATAVAAAEALANPIQIAFTTAPNLVANLSTAEGTLLQTAQELNASLNDPELTAVLNLLSLIPEVGTITSITSDVAHLVAYLGAVVADVYYLFSHLSLVPSVPVQPLIVTWLADVHKLQMQI